MPDKVISENSLVLYKGRPARVEQAGEKLEIELETGEVLKVRPKDVTLLHPGPLKSLKEIQPQQGDVETAWEIVDGGQTTLQELSDLLYGSYTPSTALAAWRLVAEGRYFRGTPEDISATTPEEVKRQQEAKIAEAANKQAWAEFLERVRRGQILPGDAAYLRDVEDLALGHSNRSRVLRELGREESPENAHSLLLKVGYWDHSVDPYPVRFHLALSPPEVDIPQVPGEARLDLTDLPAFAIDDAGSDTPDDALSVEGDCLWVHVADVAALAPPGSAVDLAAQARGATLHLPEGNVSMVPVEAVRCLGLGLNETSPALSLGLDFDANGELTGTRIVASLVRVTRLTYGEAEAKLGEAPFVYLQQVAERSAQYRRAKGALFIDFPEVRIDVCHDVVTIEPLPPLRSRAIVQEAMVRAGEAAARFGIQQDIPLPFATQERAESGELPTTLSQMFAQRRLTKRTQFKASPAPHAGLGLDAYVQATSPLRRYLDLVVHQQLRGYMRGDKLLDPQQILERAGATEAAIGGVRRVQTLAEKHWTLVYLLQNEDWRGEGIILDKRGREAIILIPSLALETRAHLPVDLPPDSTVSLSVTGVNLPRLEAHFRVLT
ncbi:MAG: ribonuclease catalytic domain-containing protein [Chloroflexi bacterium]|nr:ribonuclease catalytic domain-containing protein [Chloroflexota bacterium]